MLENYVELSEAMLYGAEKFQYEANCNIDFFWKDLM